VASLDFYRDLVAFAKKHELILYADMWRATYPFLCVVRDYVAAGSLTVEFQRFAIPGRYII
jgi:hypothetical protein